MTWQLITILGLVAVGILGLWQAIYYAAYAVRSQVLGKTAWRASTGINAVAITFDDGPTPDTLDLLDVLQRENVKATFFLIGKQVEKYPEIARRIVAENHEIGNHSYSHPIYLFCSRRKTRLELQKTQEIIEKAVGVEPKLSRPPCGVRTMAYFAAAQKLGLQTIQWSDTGFDWKNLSAEQIAQKVLDGVQKGAIILLHDGDSEGKRDRRPTIAAIPLILDGLKTKGLLVAPLRALLANNQSNGSPQTATNAFN